jgi:hypothetical protein
MQTWAVRAGASTTFTAVTVAGAAREATVSYDAVVRLVSEAERAAESSQSRLEIATDFEQRMQRARFWVGCAIDDATDSPV